MNLNTVIVITLVTSMIIYSSQISFAKKNDTEEEDDKDLEKRHSCLFNRQN